jgi:hypothetical protein
MGLEPGRRRFFLRVGSTDFDSHSEFVFRPVSDHGDSPYQSQEQRAGVPAPHQLKANHYRLGFQAHAPDFLDAMLDLLF